MIMMIMIVMIMKIIISLDPYHFASQLRWYKFWWKTEIKNIETLIFATEYDAHMGIAVYI